MKRLAVEMEIHEVKLPVGVVQSDERLEAGLTEIGDTYLTLSFERRECTLATGEYRLIIRKKEAGE